MKSTSEKKSIKNQKGKWSKTGVPHKGWLCIDIEDTEELFSICEMCESQEIRFVHHMQHKDYPKVLKVGCDCAGYMEGSLKNAKDRDKSIKSRALKRKRWLTRNWPISQKGNERIKTKGFYITVYVKNNDWSYSIFHQDKKNINSRSGYDTSDAAKLAAFDHFDQLIKLR